MADFLDAADPVDPAEPDPADPEIGIAELPSEVAGLVLRWGSQWLAQADRTKIPPTLAPYVGFRPGHQPLRVKETFGRELASSATLRQSLLEWLDSSDNKLADSSGAGNGEMAIAWLRADEQALSDLLAGRSQDQDVADAADTSQVAHLESELAKLHAELDRVRHDAKKAAEIKRKESARHQQEVAQAQSESSRLRESVRDLQSQTASLRAGSSEDSKRASQRESALAAQVRSLEKDLDSSRAERQHRRRSSRHLERLETARIQVLLSAAQSAIEGLASELPVGSQSSPAEVARSSQSVANPLPRKLGGNMISQWLSTPGLHVLVDGYNVTMAATPDLPLAQQRELLSGRLAALAARTGAEITVVFDAQHVRALMPSASRKGVRVIFTDENEIADDVIVELVSLEPLGRAVLVVTSDQEVVSAVARLGARAVSSQEFNDVIDRG